jgi:hypothetical protein
MAQTDNTIYPYGLSPDQAVENYTDEDYVKFLKFIASRWNIQTSSFTLSMQFQGNSPVAPTVEQTKGFARRYVEDLAYIYGSQVQSDYPFFVRDELGNSTRIPMFRGMDIKKYVDYTYGALRQMLKPLPKMINVTAYSEDAVSVKKTMLDIIKMKADNNALFKEIELLTGVGLKPADINFDDDYQVKKHLENFQQAMEKAYQAIAKDAAIRNLFLQKLPRAGVDVAIGGATMLEVYHHKGKVKWRSIDPVRMIFDPTKGEDQHELDDYAGEVFELTIPELLNHYKWTPEEVEDLKHMSQNVNTWGVYNTFIGINGLYWWSQNNGVPKVTCVKGQWRSLEKREGEWVEILREGVLIGNKYLREQKISEGQVWMKHDHSKKRLKYRVFTPNTRLGAVVGIVGMVKRFQDLKDAITSKMIALTSAAIGKSYFVNANKLPEGLRTPDVISQLKQSNIVVLEGVDIDETPDSKAQRLIEPVDMTLDPSITYLLEMIKYYDQVIADILNIPPSARGQLTTYQSKDVVSSSLVQSSLGMEWFYGGMMDWVKGVLEYSADLAKLVLPETEEGRDNLAFVVGDAAVEMFSMETIKEMQFQDMLLDLVPDNISAEEEKKFYKDLAMQMATAGQFTMLDAVKMRKIDTVDGLIDYFELVEIKKEQKEQAAQEAQMAANAQNQQAQIDGQKEISAMNNQTQIHKQELQGQQNIQQQDPLGLRR